MKKGVQGYEKESGGGGAGGGERVPGGGRELSGDNQDHLKTAGDSYQAIAVKVPTLDTTCPKSVI